MFSSEACALFPFELTDPKRLPFYWIATSTPTQSSVAHHRDDLSPSPVSRHSLGSPYVYRVRKVCDWLDQKHGTSGARLRDGVDKAIGWMGYV